MFTVLAVLAEARLAYKGLKPWRFYIADWRAVPQMIDGLALGETTPGPLVGVILNLALFFGCHACCGQRASRAHQASPVPQALPISALASVAN